MATPRDVDDFDAVETMEDFVDYLGLLAEDFKAEEVTAARHESSGAKVPFEGQWAHHNLGVFPGQWGAWLHDSILRPGAPTPRSEVDPLTWNKLAHQLFAARLYE
ncbi:hypothetical protein [Saccharothrix hoggarensis]|uniref:Uncharacterized protein n=1 Tax=Saccharothrix hoggarensis TaxID=913853 RepID=A0ABW3R030_9PSEU